MSEKLDGNIENTLIWNILVDILSRNALRVQAVYLHFVQL